VASLNVESRDTSNIGHKIQNPPKNKQQSKNHNTEISRNGQRTPPKQGGESIC